MFARWIWWVNCALAALGVFIMVVAFILMIALPRTVHEPEIQHKNPTAQKTLPKFAFLFSPEAYNAIGPPLLKTKIVLPSVQLPDLRPVLTYYGTNSRPDSAPGQTRLQFGLTGSQAVTSVGPGEPLYLLFDRTQNPGRYVFSPDNGTTNLWIEATNRDTDALVKVFLRDDEGQMITEPKQRGELTLQEKEFSRFGGGTWEIGKQRVDATLLARQRARWYGQDEFLNAHGGEEYEAFEHKERIEFGEGDDRYILYVGLNECLVWDGKRWQLASSVPDSKIYPVMCVKKVEDRLMRFELWDVGGKGRVALNLLKSTEAWAPQVVQREFKFVSVRTLSQYVFDIRKERVILKPGDWLLQTKEGWKKLVAPESIDAYVDGKTAGVLFVLNGVVKKDDGQAISATLYNSTRSIAAPFEIPIEHAGPSLSTPSKTEAPKTPEEAAPPTTPPASKLPEYNPPMEYNPELERRILNPATPTTPTPTPPRAKISASATAPTPSRKLESSYTPVRPLKREVKN